MADFPLDRIWSPFSRKVEFVPSFSLLAQEVRHSSDIFRVLVSLASVALNNSVTFHLIQDV